MNQPTPLIFWLPIPYHSAHLIYSPFAYAKIPNESVRGNSRKGIITVFKIN